MPLQYNLGGQAAQYDGSNFGLSSFFGGVAVGRDQSDNFAMTLSGVAVRRSDGACVTMDADRDALIDVTPLVLLGVDPYVVRVPISARALRRGDLVILSDSPFSALYVLRRQEDFGLVGLDPMAEQIVTCTPALNLFVNFFVAAVSLFDLMTGKGATEDEGKKARL